MSWRRAARFLPAAGFVVLAAAVMVRRGVPLSRDWLFAWIVGVLACLCLGSLTRLRRLFADWLPLAAALTLYDVLRGVGGGRVPIRYREQIWLDEHVFGAGAAPTVWLQRRLWNPTHVRWYDYAAWTVHTSYFLVTPVLLGVLWLRDPSRFRRYARLLTELSFASVAIFAALPSLPPWLAAQKGYLPPVARLITPIGGDIPHFDTTSLWESGLRIGNDIAAFPSLHQAMTLLIVLYLWSSARPLVRAGLVVYAVAMAFSLVYTGEHYVVDVVAGSLLAVAVVWLDPIAVRYVAARRTRESAPEAVPDSLAA